MTKNSNALFFFSLHCASSAGNMYFLYFMFYLPYYLPLDRLTILIQCKQNKIATIHLSPGDTISPQADADLYSLPVADAILKGKGMGIDV